MVAMHSFDLYSANSAQAAENNGFRLVWALGNVECGIQTVNMSAQGRISIHPYHRQR